MKAILGVVEPEGNSSNERLVETHRTDTALVRASSPISPQRKGRSSFMPEGPSLLNGAAGLSSSIAVGASSMHVADPAHLYASVNGTNGDMVPLAAAIAASERAKLMYTSHYTGLKADGRSGMTIQDELTDLALKACENGRGAVLLSVESASSLSAIR